MIASGRFLQSALLLFFSLAALVHFYFNRTTLNPHYAKVFYRSGVECQNECDLDERLRYFQKAVYYDPNLTDAYYQLGVVYGQKGESEKEFMSYQKAAALDHTYADAYFRVGRHYFERGKLDYALRYLLQANRQKSGFYDVYYYFAQVYERRQMYEDAIDYYAALITEETRFAAEACKRIWDISEVPSQHEMVRDKINKRHQSLRHHGLLRLWEQIDRCVKTEQVPGFVPESSE